MRGKYKHFVSFATIIAFFNPAKFFGMIFRIF
jgi:hypothetical protein